MDTVSNGNDEIDYISDSCSDSSQSDYDLDLQSDNESSSDIDFGNTNTTDLDFSVPDIKANPPNWTHKIESISVPPPKNKGGPTLPAAYSNLLRAVDYFQLFFTDSLITQIVQYTNQYAQIEITKKCHTQPNYIDKQWSWKVQMMYLLKKCMCT